MTLFIGLVLLFSIIFLANHLEVHASDSTRRMFNWLLLLFNLPVFLLGLSFLLLSADQLQAGDLGLGINDYRPAGIVLLLTAVWGLLSTLPEVRRFLSRWIPLDPGSAVHTLALILAGYLIGNSVLTLTQGGLEGLAETSEPASIISVVVTEALYAAVGLAGVGLFIRRGRWKLLERLRLERPTAEQLKRGLRWVGLLLLLQWITGAITLFTNPEQAEVLEELNTLLLGEMDTIWEWFLLAVSAAVGEEILFRGALQPVFGLWLTSFIFAFAHVQYGFSPATVLVFVIGVILGLVRRRHNTTTAIFVHFAYNFILGLFALALPYLERLAT